MTTPFPYQDACNNTFTTLGEGGQIPFQYLDACGDTSFYTNADQNVILGPIFLPKIYAKDLDVLELASSGQVVMSIQDQASLAFRNNTTNNVTNMESQNNQAIAFIPTDTNNTIDVGATKIDTYNNYQRLHTTEPLGYQILNPTNIANTLDVNGSSSFLGSLQVASAVTTESTLSVADAVYLKKTLDVSGAVVTDSTLVLRSDMNVTGSGSFESTLSVSNQVLLNDVVEVKWQTTLEDTIVVEVQTLLGDTAVIQDKVTMESSLNVKSLMDVSGTTTLQSSLYVKDSVFANTSLDVKCESHLYNTLYTYGSGHVTENVNVTGSVKLSSTLTVHKNVFLQSSLDVSGATLIRDSFAVGDTVDIQGHSILNSTLRVDGSVVAKSTTDVCGSTFLRGFMSVVGHGELSDHLDVNGAVSMNSSVVVCNVMDVSGTTNLKGELITSGSTLLKNEGNFLGAVRLQSTLFVANNVSIDKGLDISGATYTHSGLIVNDYLLVQGDTRLSSTLTVAKNASLQSTLQVQSEVRLQSTLNVNGYVFNQSTLTVQGGTAFNSTLTVSGSTAVNGNVTLESSMITTSGGYFTSTVDVSGSMRLSSTLLVKEDMDVCGNVSISGQFSTSKGASFSGPVTLRSTLSVNGTTYLNNEMQTNIVRPYTQNTLDGAALTIDAQKVLINGSVDLVGSINHIFNETSTFLLEDKLVTLAHDICGNGTIMDGTNTNNESGIKVDGLPNGIASDPEGLYDKSFTWNYDSLNNDNWTNMGKNSLNNTTLPKEPTWILRGGAFKLAHKVDGSNSVVFTMRINAYDEYEIWQSISSDCGITWSHRKVNRFGMFVPVDQVSIISAFTASLGETGVGTNTASLRITTISDNLYPTKRVTPIFTVTNIYLIDVSNNQYTVQPGFSFGSISGNDRNDVVVVGAQMVTGLPSNTQFKAVRAVISNQYGSTALLNAPLSPYVATLDASGPQVVGYVYSTGNAGNHTIDVSMNTYDVGYTTDAYNGVVLVSRSSSYDISNITTSTPNTQPFLGTGKTPATSDYNTFNFSTDISGSSIGEGLYYVYYAMYDPLGNKTTNQYGPIVSANMVPSSSISAFTVSLGATVVGSTTLSLKVTSITDSLYASWGIVPEFTVSAIKLVDSSDNEYAVQGGFSFGLISGNSTNNTVNVIPQTVSGLPSNTQFKAVKATITNQYGSYGSLTENVSPYRATLDTNGPQVVGSVYITTNDLTRAIDVSFNTFDLGFTTTSYTGVVFVSPASSYTLSSITTSTPNTKSFTGSGKTSGTSDLNSLQFTTDISGTVLTIGTYYLYYVLYDPLGNRTTNQVGPSVSTAIKAASSITAFAVALGETTVGTTSLSLKVASVTDNLYATRGVISQYTASNVKLIAANDVEYSAQVGFTLGTFSGNTLNYLVSMSPQTITGLPSDTYFKAVKATITNQYGVSASLTSTVSPNKATYDTTSPTVVGQVSVTQGTNVFDVSLSIYDVGQTTTEYYGILFASTTASYDVSNVAINVVTPYSYTFTGTGKTSGTADYRSTKLTVDVSGVSIAAGTYYVYYLLYDPAGNRTTGRLGPYTLAQPFVQNMSLELNPTLVAPQKYAVCNNMPLDGISFTISTWVKLFNLNPAVQTEYSIVTQHKTDTFAQQLWCRIHSGGTPYMGLRSSTHSGGQITDTNWHHVVFMYNRSTQQKTIFLDTTRYDGTTNDGLLNTSGINDLYLGMKYDGTLTNAFSGRMDEVGIWNAALSSAEITAIFNSGTPLNLRTNYGSYASSGNLQAYWQFDSQNGVDTTTGGTRPLTFYNTPVAYSTDVPYISSRVLTFGGALSATTSTAVTATAPTEFTVSTWVKSSDVSTMTTVDMGETTITSSVSTSFYNSCDIQIVLSGDNWCMLSCGEAANTNTFARFGTISGGFNSAKNVTMSNVSFAARKSFPRVLSSNVFMFATNRYTVGGTQSATRGMCVSIVNANTTPATVYTTFDIGGTSFEHKTTSIGMLGNSQGFYYTRWVDATQTTTTFIHFVNCSNIASLSSSSITNLTYNSTNFDIEVAGDANGTEYLFVQRHNGTSLVIERYPISNKTTGALSAQNLSVAYSIHGQMCKFSTNRLLVVTSDGFLRALDVADLTSKASIRVSGRTSARNCQDVINPVIQVLSDNTVTLTYYTSSTSNHAYEVYYYDGNATFTRVTPYTHSVDSSGSITYVSAITTYRSNYGWGGITTAPNHKIIYPSSIHQAATQTVYSQPLRLTNTFTGGFRWVNPNVLSTVGTIAVPPIVTGHTHGPEFCVILNSWGATSLAVYVSSSDYATSKISALSVDNYIHDNQPISIVHNTYGYGWIFARHSNSATQSNKRTLIFAFKDGNYFTYDLGTYSGYTYYGASAISNTSQFAAHYHYEHFGTDPWSPAGNKPVILRMINNVNTATTSAGITAVNLQFTVYSSNGDEEICSLGIGGSIGSERVYVSARIVTSTFSHAHNNRYAIHVWNVNPSTMALTYQSAFAYDLGTQENNSMLFIKPISTTCIVTLDKKYLLRVHDLSMNVLASTYIVTRMTYSKLGTGGGNVVTFDDGSIYIFGVETVQALKFHTSTNTFSQILSPYRPLDLFTLNTSHSRMGVTSRREIVYLNSSSKLNFVPVEDIVPIVAIRDPVTSLNKYLGMTRMGTVNYVDSDGLVSAASSYLSGQNTEQIYNNIILTETATTTLLMNNGYVDSSASRTRNVIANPPYLDIGKTLFKGSMDEVAFWNTGLTNAQMSSIYNSGFPGNPLQHPAVSSLKAYYSFETSDGSDRSGNTNTLSYTGTPSYTVDSVKCAGALDLVGMVSAHGLRLINPTYTGPVVEVRRSTDNQVVRVYMDRVGKVVWLDVVGGSPLYGPDSFTQWASAASVTLSVIKLYDQSNNGKHFDTVITNFPTTNKSLNYIQFNGSSGIRGLGSLTTADNTYSFATCWKGGNVANANAQVLFDTAGGGTYTTNNRACLMIQGNTSSLKFSGAGNDTVQFSAVSNSVTYRTIMNIDNNVTNNVTIINNDVSVSAATTSRATLSVTPTNQSIGANMVNGEYFNGFIYETIIFNTVTTASQNNTIRSIWKSVYNMP